MSALTKKALTQALSVKMQIDEAKAKAYVDHFFSVLTDAVVTYDEVQLRKFGKFELQKKCERPGRNPKTGEPHVIPELHKIAFKASEYLKQLLNP